MPFPFRDDIHELKDLQPGMVCPGIVTNVTNFGAFVDIGVHQDGLVHISQLADQFVKDPQRVVSPGDRVTVRVLEVKLDKKQIALTMSKEAPERRKPRPKDARPRPPRVASPARPNAARPNRPATPPGAAKGKAPTPEKPRPPRDAKPGPRPPTSKPAPPPPRQKPAFNNPFAVLARLKDPGKS